MVDGLQTATLRFRFVLKSFIVLVVLLNKYSSFINVQKVNSVCLQHIVMVIGTQV